MVCLSIVAAIAIFGLLTVNHLQTKDFINYLSQYDFVSQDGEGYNYYNSDVGGDVNNGTENPEAESRKKKKGTAIRKSKRGK